MTFGSVFCIWVLGIPLCGFLILTILKLIDGDAYSADSDLGGAILAAVLWPLAIVGVLIWLLAVGIDYSSSWVVKKALPLLPNSQREE